MAKTNYDNIDGKSVWDLYVENFLTGLWDLAPKFAWDENGIRVVVDEEKSSPPKPKKKKAIKKSKETDPEETDGGLVKTGRIGDEVEDVLAKARWNDEGGLTRPPMKVKAKEVKT